jgi:hypothetical protein
MEQKNTVSVRAYIRTTVAQSMGWRPKVEERYDWWAKSVS